MADQLKVTAQVVGRYAGQTWPSGFLSDNINQVWFLTVIVKDLGTDVRAKGVNGDIELWANDCTGDKGFFVGDTAVLAAKGWRKLATL